MSDENISAIAEKVMSEYQAQLDKVVKDHEALLESSRASLASLIAESNQQLSQLAEKMSVEAAEPEAPKPEVAWVAASPDGKKDHLVLNPQAVEMLDRLFGAINDVLPEIAKLIKKR